MKARLLLFLSLPFLIPVFLHAQKYTLRGTLTDSTKAPIAGVTAMLLSTKDSSLLSFGRTDAGGAFEMKNIIKGTYLLRCTYFGYQNVQKEVQLDKDVDLGTMLMREGTNVLGAVEVVGERSPVTFRHDTTEFNYSHHQKTKGLGYLTSYSYSSTKEKLFTQGLLMHASMAMTLTGVPLGLLYQKQWIRKIENLGRIRKSKQNYSYSRKKKGNNR